MNTCLFYACSFEEFHEKISLHEIDIWKLFDAVLCVSDLPTLRVLLAALPQSGKSLLIGQLCLIANRARVAQVNFCHRDLKNMTDFVEKQLWFKLRERVAYADVADEMEDYDVTLARIVPGGGASRRNDGDMKSVLSRAGCVGALLNPAQVKALKEAIRQTNPRYCLRSLVCSMSVSSSLCHRSVHGSRSSVLSNSCVVHI